MEFYCHKCGKCCKDESIHDGIVIIYPSEVTRLANAVDCSERDFLEEYCLRDYISVDKTDYLIYKLKKNSNQCIFLHENLCSIYKDRPIQCKRAPYGIFSQKEIWGNLPCLRNKEFPIIDTKKEDIELVKELIKGYKN